jgi:hypothetical protein
MEMGYFWTCEKDAQDVYSFKWYPRMENLVDYQSKYHPGHITPLFGHTIYTRNIPPWNFLVQLGLAL